jgi:hypothetical protein
VVACISAMSLVQGCASVSNAPDAPASTSSAVPMYTGPFYSDVSGYVKSGTPFDFTHGLSADDAARAIQAAEQGTEALSSNHEVGLVEPVAAPDAGACEGDCVEVTLIDYTQSSTYTTFVDLSSLEVSVGSVQQTVLAAPGEEGVRELYGIALKDPAVSSAVGDDFVVQPLVSPFSKTGTSCSEDLPSPDRCLYGVIFTPTKEVFVYVDLTAVSVIDSNVEKQGEDGT